MLNPRGGLLDNVVVKLLLCSLLRPKGSKKLVVVLLGEGDGDAVVVVLDQLLLPRR